MDFCSLKGFNFWSLWMNYGNIFNWGISFSVGILRYLCREKGVSDHWYPKDSKQQARVDEYLEWQHLNTRANCALYFRAKVCKTICTLNFLNIHFVFCSSSCQCSAVIPLMKKWLPREWETCLSLWTSWRRFGWKIIGHSWLETKFLSPIFLVPVKLSSLVSP